MPGCTAYIDPEIAVGLLNAGGTATWSIPIPFNPLLVGQDFYVQGLVLDFGANAANVVVSNAGDGVIGTR